MGYANLCLSGGHLKVASFLGCIAAMDETNPSMMQGFKNFAGTSAGALLCLMCVLRYTFQEMMECTRTLVQRFGSLDHQDIEGAFEAWSGMGVISGDRLDRVVWHVLEQKEMPKQCTFVELAKKTGRNLIVSGFNVSTSSHEYFSVDSYPNMCVHTAIRISMSLPVLFRPYEMDGMLYCDAGISNNFPIHVFKSTCHLHDTLGISVQTDSNSNPGNIVSYVGKLLHHITDVATEHTIASSHNADFNKQPNYDVVYIQCQDEGLFDMEHMCFSLSEDLFQSMVQKGRDAMNAHISRITHENAQTR